MRSGFSQTATATLFARSSPQTWLTLLTADLTSVTPGTYIRVCNDPGTNHVSDGNTFKGYPFRFAMPVDDESEPPRGQLIINNVDHSFFDDGGGGDTGLIWWLRQMVNPLPLVGQLVLASAPDVVEIEVTLWARLAEYDLDVISADLLPEPIWDENFPGYDFNPYHTPGVFTEPTSDRGRSLPEPGAIVRPGGFDIATPYGPRRRRGRR